MEFTVKAVAKITTALKTNKSQSLLGSVSKKIRMSEVDITKFYEISPENNRNKAIPVIKAQKSNNGYYPYINTVITKIHSAATTLARMLVQKGVISRHFESRFKWVSGGEDQICVSTSLKSEVTSIEGTIVHEYEERVSKISSGLNCDDNDSTEKPELITVKTNTNLKNY
jgi:hypothetical protein